MVPRRWAMTFVCLAAMAGSGCSFPPAIGSTLMVRPFRLPIFSYPERPYEDFELGTDDGFVLRGWMFRPRGPPRGLIIYLHGFWENRRLGARIADRYVPRGYAVLAYDSRANGESGGKFTTFGFHEVSDLRKAIDTIGIVPVILIGESLGASVALQEAASDPRVKGVVAAAPFADLVTRIRETAGPISPDASIAEAERQAGFRMSTICPRCIAARIQAPVLILHGGRDTWTLIHHSQEIADALKGPKAFLVFEGANHLNILTYRGVWPAIDKWIVRLPS